MTHSKAHFHVGVDGVKAVWRSPKQPGREVVLAICDVGYETWEAQGGEITTYGPSCRDLETAVADFKARAN